MYFAPSSRISNSRALSPAQMTCVCGSTNPGITTFPPASSIRSSALRLSQLRRAADGRDPAIPDQHGAVRDDPQSSKCRAALRAASNRKQFTGRMDQHGGYFRAVAHMFSMNSK